MRVLVVGASCVIGARLVPSSAGRGHDVIASSRSPGKAEWLRGLGAQPIVLEAPDATAVREAVAAARPDAIAYQATALADLSDFKHFDRSTGAFPYETATPAFDGKPPPRDDCGAQHPSPVLPGPVVGAGRRSCATAVSAGPH